MAIVQVQKKGAGGTNGVTVTLDSAPTVGNLLIAVHMTRVTDSTPPAGWTEAIAVTNATEADQGAIYYRVVQTGDGTAYTFGASNDQHAAEILEYSGLSATPLDQTASTGRTAAATSISSGTTANTTQADELAIAAALLRADVTSPSFTNSFTLEANQTGGPGGTSNATVLVGSKVLAATGAIESTAAWTTANAAMGAIATFKAAAAETVVKDIIQAGIIPFAR